MIVYRMEHSRVTDERIGLGAGPYSMVAYYWSSERWPKRLPYLAKLGEASDRLCKAGRSADLTPPPAMDGGIGYITAHEACGCVSRDAIIRWFGPSVIRKWAKEFEYRVSRYDVPDAACRVGQSGQVVFVAEQARFVGTEEV